MKSLKTAVVSTVLLAITLTLAPFGLGQATANPKFAANAAGRVMAAEFAKYAFQSQTGISSGAQTVTLNGCYIKVGTAYELFYPIAVNTPLLITDGANTETVTPTAVTQPTADAKLKNEKAFDEAGKFLEQEQIPPGCSDRLRRSRRYGQGSRVDPGPHY
jgi:hypothetical protein